MTIGKSLLRIKHILKKKVNQPAYLTIVWVILNGISCRLQELKYWVAVKSKRGVPYSKQIKYFRVYLKDPVVG
ncbi:hypothetical protein NEOC84_001457|nr:hypothetical protein [Neochlamydia sp. AcF84]